MSRSALENTSSLRESFSQKNKEFDVLCKLNQSAANGYLEHLLNLIVQLVSEFIKCDICSINIHDPDHDTLVVRATHSLDTEYLKTRLPIPVHQSLAGVAFLERRPFQWKDVTKEALFYYKPMAKKLGLKSLLAIPMMVKFKPLGVINFYTTSLRHFKESEIEFLQLVANQAALALERDSLINEISKSKKALQERKLIEKAKGIVMKKKNITEQEAYELLRATSMSSRKLIVDVAKAILLADGI